MNVWKGGAKSLVLIIIWAALLLGGIFPASAAAVHLDRAAANQGPAGGDSLDFDACARLAIRQSPFLTKSDLEIQVRHLNEADSKSDFLPAFSFRTRYYVNNLSQSGLGSSSPYSLDFTSDPYSPVEAYFSLQVRKLFSRIAVLNHLKAISEGLHRLGRSFLEVDALGKVAQVQADFNQIAEKRLSYMQERQKIGEGTTLEIKVASQELEVGRLNQKQLLNAIKKHQEGIRAYLGWPANQEFHLDLPPSRQQVLGKYESLAHLDEALPGSTFDLKIQAVKKELQTYNITLAKTKMLPTLFMGAQTPDPLTLVQSRSFFFYMGASIPVWDGFKRWRNISRQKTVLQQVDAETHEKEFDFQEKWREAQNSATDAATQLKMSLSQLELATLKERQAEVRYHSMGDPFSVYLEGEKGVYEAKKNVIMKTLEYDLAKLNLRHLANDLVSRYVDENSLPARSEKNK
jgi:outer membrane protein TolC